MQDVSWKVVWWQDHQFAARTYSLSFSPDGINQYAVKHSISEELIYIHRTNATLSQLMAEVVAKLTTELSKKFPFAPFKEIEEDMWNIFTNAIPIEIEVPGTVPIPLIRKDEYKNNPATVSEFEGVKDLDESLWTTGKDLL